MCWRWWGGGVGGDGDGGGSGGDDGAVADVGMSGGGNFLMACYGGPVGGGTPSPFPDDAGWDLLVQKCTCVAKLTQVPSIPATSPLR